jgi:hypothetical protein
MEIQGKLIVINDTKEIGTSGFRKREAVVETSEGQYPQTILVEFTKDKCDLLDSYNIGDQVTLSCNLNGRKWTSPSGEDKYFNSIGVWRISGQPAAQPAQPAAPYIAPPLDLSADEDDLPF